MISARLSWRSLAAAAPLRKQLNRRECFVGKSSQARPTWRALSGVEVFDEDNFVLCFVVDEFVHHRADEKKAESARPQTFFHAHIVVRARFVWRIRKRRMLEALEAKARAGIGDAVQEHAFRAQVGDAY